MFEELLWHWKYSSCCQHSYLPSLSLCSQYAGHKIQQVGNAVISVWGDVCGEGRKLSTHNPRDTQHLPPAELARGPYACPWLWYKMAERQSERR